MGVGGRRLGAEGRRLGERRCEKGSTTRLGVKSRAVHRDVEPQCAFHNQLKQYQHTDTSH